jgi:hypothetical protein
VLKKIVVYYTRKHKNVKIKIGYDLKLLSFLMTKHWIFKESGHFQKFIFIKNDEEKKCHVFRQL